MSDQKNNGQYIQVYGIRCLIGGKKPELERDADTGGQAKYVLELANYLCRDKRLILLRASG
jgi:sucrose-phosphate synthase